MNQRTMIMRYGTSGKIALGEHENSAGLDILKITSDDLNIPVCAGVPANLQLSTNINYIGRGQKPAKLRPLWIARLKSGYKLIGGDWLLMPLCKLNDTARNASVFIKLLFLRVCHGGVCKWPNIRS